MICFDFFFFFSFSCILLKKQKVGTEFSILAVDGVKPKIVQPDGPIHDITDAVPLEVARQMALLEFDFFKKIMPWECYGLGLFIEDFFAFFWF